MAALRSAASCGAGGIGFVGRGASSFAGVKRYCCRTCRTASLRSAAVFASACFAPVSPDRGARAARQHAPAGTENPGAAGDRPSAGTPRARLTRPLSAGLTRSSRPSGMSASSVSRACAAASATAGSLLASASASGGTARASRDQPSSHAALRVALRQRRGPLLELRVFAVNDHDAVRLDPVQSPLLAGVVERRLVPGATDPGAAGERLRQRPADAVALREDRQQFVRRVPSLFQRSGLGRRECDDEEEGVHHGTPRRKERHGVATRAVTYSIVSLGSLHGEPTDDVGAVALLVLDRNGQRPRRHVRERFCQHEFPAVVGQPLELLQPGSPRLVPRRSGSRRPPGSSPCPGRCCSRACRRGCASAAGSRRPAG